MNAKIRLMGVKDEFFSTKANILVNTVNCQGVMGIGLAKEMRERFPEMFNCYKKACREGELKPGGLHVWKGERGFPFIGDDKNITIINFATKDDYSYPSRYGWISNGLNLLANILNSYKTTDIAAIPALGCGYGGLDWEIVRGMIEGALERIKPEIYLFPPVTSRTPTKRLKI